jgi:NHL repeat
VPTTAALSAQNIASTVACVTAYWCYTADTTYTGPTGVVLQMAVDANSCPNDQVPTVDHVILTRVTVPSAGSSGASLANASLKISLSASQYNESYDGATAYNYNDACLTNSATFSQAGGTPASCTFIPDKVLFASTDVGYHNTAPTPVIINCSALVLTYTVGGSVSGLPAGTSLLIADTINGDSSTVSANGSYTLAAQLATGAQYNITATPSNSTVNCVVSNGSGSIGTTNAFVAINCGGGSGGGIPPVALNNPNGLLWVTPYLFVANSGGANGGQVLVYSEQLNNATDHLVSGLTLVASITQGINIPARLAVDANNQLYVTNLGNNTVTVYNISAANIAANTIAQVTAATISSGITRPLGIAVDSSGLVYVANNSANSISIFQPASGGGFTQVGGALTSDGESNLFLAPGALYFDRNDDVLFVGLGPSASASGILSYTPPLTASSRPLFLLSGSSCASAPSGPTGFGYLPTGEAQVSISSYYNSSVSVYGLVDLIGRGSGGACPLPDFSSLNGASSVTQIARPEGVVPDGVGNLFVANSSANTVTAYAPGVGIAAAPVYTQH